VYDALNAESLVWLGSSAAVREAPCYPSKARWLMSWRDRIVSNPDVMGGQVCIKGTRIPVSVVLDNLAAGLSEAEITVSYPSLVGDDVRAALQYAAELAHEQLIPLRGTGT